MLSGNALISDSEICPKWLHVISQPSSTTTALGENQPMYVIHITFQNWTTTPITGLNFWRESPNDFTHVVHCRF